MLQDVIYLAGLFDGEGCIFVSRQNSGRSHYLGVTITNTNVGVLKLAKRMFGGSIRQNSDSRKHRTTSWVWRIVSNQAENALKTLLPYLRIKRQEAELALDFQKLLHATFVFHRKIGISTDVIAQRDAYYWALRECKFNPAYNKERL